jgi:hypothetical protein
VKAFVGWPQVLPLQVKSTVLVRHACGPVAFAATVPRSAASGVVVKYGSVRSDSTFRDSFFTGTLLR